ncbi:MAG: hypothetical protein RLZZ21_870 [Planctomycetota bacterium]|jgi:hypothetical protein
MHRARELIGSVIETGCRPFGIWAAMAACLSGIVGCGSRGPARLEQPRFDTAKVIAGIDANADGAIDASEQQAVPAIAAAAARLDGDGDSVLTVAELIHWLEQVRATKVAIAAFSAVVTQQGKPLPNVTVKLVPEPFMGTEIKAAEGVTDKTGNVVVSIPGSPYAGVNCGVYRSEFSGSGIDGKPLGERFNTRSTFGVLVGGPFPEQNVVTFALD